MLSLKKQFAKLGTPIFFINFWAEKIIGLEDYLPNIYFISAYNSSIFPYLKKKCPVFCLGEHQKLNPGMVWNAGKLMEAKKVQEYILSVTKGKKAYAITFKNSPKFTLQCKKLNLRVLYSSPRLINSFENKISFLNFCIKHKLPILPTIKFHLGEYAYTDLKSKLGKKIVIQTNIGHAGNGTHFIESDEKLKTLEGKNLHLPAKATPFIEGLTLTINACTGKNGTVVSNVLYQVTGIKELTKYTGGTCGTNSYKAKCLPPYIIEHIKNITRKIGNIMRESKFLGWFGLDFIYDPTTKSVYLLECNSRITATIAPFTTLQVHGNDEPFLAYQIAEFLGFEYKSRDTEVHFSTLIMRNLSDKVLTVGKSLRAGIYDLKLRFLRPSYQISDLKNKKEILLFPHSSYSFANPEKELCNIYYRGDTLNTNFKLKPEFQKIIKELQKLYLK